MLRGDALQSGLVHSRPSGWERGSGVGAARRRHDDSFYLSVFAGLSPPLLGVVGTEVPIATAKNTNAETIGVDVAG